MDTYNIVWNPDLSVGDEEIDSQHKKLIDLIGSIPDDSSSSEDVVLEEVLRYAATHFASEEALLARIEYPALAEHKRNHRKLVTILTAYKRDYECGKTDLYDFKQFMYRWVRDHIMDEDQEYGRYLKSRNDAASSSEGGTGG
ncbi:MAG: bacteriohemerythrin [Gaiellales bacterium]